MLYEYDLELDLEAKIRHMNLEFKQRNFINSFSDAVNISRILKKMKITKGYCLKTIERTKLKLQRKINDAFNLAIQQQIARILKYNRKKDIQKLAMIINEAFNSGNFKPWLGTFLCVTLVSKKLKAEVNISKYKESKVKNFVKLAEYLSLYNTIVTTFEIIKLTLDIIIKSYQDLYEVQHSNNRGKHGFNCR